MTAVPVLSFILAVFCALRGSGWAIFWLIPFLVWA